MIYIFLVLQNNFASARGFFFFFGYNFDLLVYFYETASASLMILYCALQSGANCMLEEWEENLAVITANRTKDDELVIIHLGDCLWKEHGEVLCMCFHLY